jgi:hypothetical protein
MKRIGVIIMTTFSVLIITNCASDNYSLETGFVNKVDNQAYHNSELIIELEESINKMAIKSIDLSQVLEQNEDVLYLFNEAREKKISTDSLKYSINNLLLKLYLHHLRNGCSGANIGRPDNETADWILEIAKSQTENQSQFKEITNSGFIYDLINEDSSNYAFDYNLFNLISLRIDSCLNYNPESYPKNFRP